MRAEDLRVRAWQFRTLQSGQLSGAALENVLRHRARALDVDVAERGGGADWGFRLCGWRLDGSGVGR
ncbi:hypothetical protein Dimus_003077, partial [Dionaea muscipula]